jgi:hypothetical protein
VQQYSVWRCACKGEGGAGRKGQDVGCRTHDWRWYGGRCGAAVPQFAERLRRSGGLDVDGVAVGVQWLSGARVWQGKAGCDRGAGVFVLCI